MASANMVSTISDTGVLTEDILVKGSRLTFQLVRIEDDQDSEVRIHPLKGRGSADIFAAATANGYISLYPEITYNAGTKIEFEYTGARRWQN